MLIDITIDYKNHDRRIDHFLHSVYKDTPVSHIQKMLRKGLIRLNTKKTTASARIYAGDTLSLPKPNNAPVPAYMYKKKALYDKAIIYDSSDYLIIDKPPYIPVQKGSGHETSLIDDLENYYGHKLYLVHRLDKLTSGVMIIAKYPAMQTTLSTYFKEKKMHKVYHCVVENWKLARSYTLDAPLLRIRDNFMDTSIVNPAGKDSRSIFTVLKEHKGLSLLEVQIITGRMHQIRAHTLHLKAPIVGDSLYNPHSSIQAPGLMLLAQSLSFHDAETRSFNGLWPDDKLLWLKKMHLLDEK